MICRGLPQELERFERQFQWYIEKALGCIIALDTNQGKFKHSIRTASEIVSYLPQT